MEDSNIEVGDKQEVKKNTCIHMHEILKTPKITKTCTIKPPCGVMITIPPSPKSKAIKNRRNQLLRERQLQARRFFHLAISLAITIIITSLILLQRSFSETIEHELRSIEKISSTDGYGPYPTEDTPPYVLLDEEIIMSTSGDDANILKLGSAQDVTTHRSTEMANDLTSGSKSVNKESLNDVNANKIEANPAPKGMQETFAFLPKESVEDAKKYAESKSSTIAPNENLDGDDFHGHDKTERIIDYMKLNVIFKVYAYTYIFYLTIMVLLMLQFLIIIRMFAQ